MQTAQIILYGSVFRAYTYAFDKEMERDAVFKFFSKRGAGKSQNEYPVELHLNSIKTSLKEIRKYKKKRVATNPTQIHWKPIDIEEAWPSSSTLVASTYRAFCKVASELHLDPGPADCSSSFKAALTAFIDLVDRTGLHIKVIRDTRRLSPRRLQAIDNEIMMIQHSVNKIHTHITKDFVYSTRPQTQSGERQPNPSPPTGKNPEFVFAKH